MSSAMAQKLIERLSSDDPQGDVAYWHLSDMGKCPT